MFARQIGANQIALNHIKGRPLFDTDAIVGIGEDVARGGGIAADFVKVAPVKMDARAEQVGVVDIVAFDEVVADLFDIDAAGKVDNFEPAHGGIAAAQIKAVGVGGVE